MSKKAEIMAELLRMLEGKCSQDFRTCPMYISEKLFGTSKYWIGNDCMDNFLWLAGREHQKRRAVGECCYKCPCDSGINPDLLITRIHEIIQEEEDTLNKAMNVPLDRDPGRKVPYVS